MVNPRAERSRLGDLLVEMRLVDPDTLTAAIAEHRSSGRRLPRVLAERRVLDEERLAKAVAAKLGLEAVNVGTLKIHERVLSLVPADVARKYGVLPIAIKRTNQAELLYLVMVDPLDTEAIGEVQRLTGRQVRVLMATSSDVDHAIESQYRRAAAHAAQTQPPRAAAAVPPAATLPTQRPPARPSPPAGLPPPIVRGTPAPTGAPPAAPSAERRFPARDQATLIDSARPPEVEALIMPQSEHPTDGGDDELVMPQELDGPEEAHTRIDPGPFAKLESSDSGPAPKPGLDRDWDLAVRAWDDFGADGSAAPPPPPEPASPAPSDISSSFDALEIADEDDGDDDTGDDGEDLKTSQLDVSAMGVSDLGRSPPPVAPESASDTPRNVNRTDRAERRALASTLEVPIEFAEDYHPFDGPSVDEIPVGLEKTGIIPAIDWEREEFEPPPLETEAASTSTADALVGSTDIPLTPEAVRARSGDAKKKSASDEDVIEAIEEVSLEPLDPDDVVRIEEPEEYGKDEKAPAPKPKSAAPAKPAPPAAPPAPPAPPQIPKLPKAAPAKPPSKVLPPLPKPTPTAVPNELPRPLEAAEVSPPTPPAARPPIQAAEDSDAADVPVIEPSSLVSLMDDGVEHGHADTGADEAPMGPWADADRAPATRLFDESNRQVVQAPEIERVGAEEEPTNPRIDTSTVQAALASEQGTVTVGADPIAPLPPPEKAPPRDTTTLDVQGADVEAAEEPTPSQDTVDRDSVLSALDGAFWEPSGSDEASPEAPDEPEPAPPAKPQPKAPAAAPPKTPAKAQPKTPEAPPQKVETQPAMKSETARMVDDLIAGESLKSAERAQVLLALGRLLLDKGVITREELILMLDQ